MKIHDKDVFAAACRTSLPAFVHAFNRRSIDRYVHRPYIDLLAAYIEDGLQKGGSRSVINIPPRHTKTSTELAAVAWYIGRHPAKEVLLVTHNADLARHLAGLLRNIFQDGFYRDVFGQLQLEEGRTSLTDFRTTQGGGILVASIDSGITGRGADVIFVDDPISINNALSQTERDRVYNAFQSMVATRLNRPSEGSIFCIGQRVHMDDLSGRLLQQGYDHLCLPARAEQDEQHTVNGIIFERAQNTFLLADLFGPEQAAKVSEFDWLRLYQQRPQLLKSGLLKPQHFAVVQSLPEGGRPIVSLDVAASLANNASWSVGLMFQKFADVSYLRHILRGRFEYGELRRCALSMHERWKPLFLIEKASLGVSLADDLRRAGANVFEMTPGPSSKEDRLLSVINLIEANYVRPVANIPGLSEFLEECYAFPYGSNDDQIDALSQYLRWVRDNETSNPDLVLLPIRPRGGMNTQAGVRASVLRMVR